MKNTVQKILSLILCLALLLVLVSCKQNPSGTLDAATTVADNAQPLNSGLGESTNQPEENLPSASCNHTDADADLYCDNCEIYVLVELDIFAINDIHGKFTDSDTQPGVDELTTYLQTRQGNVILLSSGDTWQGSSESNLTYGRLMTDWMNRLGFAAMTLGNHEFDWGTNYIAQNAEYAEFPLLAINVYETDTKQRAEYCKPSAMVECGGIKVGIIGAIGDCYGSVAAEKVQDVYFITGSELTQLVKAESERLQSLGADIIVYSIHDGYDRNGTAGTVSSYQLSPYYDTSLSNGSVDIVFEAHTHKNYAFKDEHGVYHLQGGGENKGIIQAEFTYNIATDEIAALDAEYIPNSVYSSLASSPMVDELLEKYEAEISKGYQELGFNGKNRNDKELREITAKLYYEAGVERWGDEYEIVLGGGSFSIRNPYSLSVGNVTYSHVQSLMPFDNQIVLCSVKGSDLNRRFINNSDDRYAIYLGEYGNSVKNNIDPNGTYYIITDTWSSDYAPNRLTEIARYDDGVYARDLFADYIAIGALDDGFKQEGYTLTDIATVLSVGKKLSPNASSSESYYVKGTVTSIANQTYGNMYIADENGNSIYIYGLYDLNGKRYDSMENKPRVGDTITVYGSIKNYVPQGGSATVEFMNATLIK